ncbi:MAG: hypothetical protein ACKO3W_10190 [bacterium]
MLKFLRQYNQWILVVGGTLLLITFLMPTAIQSCAQQSAVSGAVWATYSGGQRVTGADLEKARQEMQIIELAGSGMLKQIGADREPAHWWLLAHEAQQAGLIGDLGDGEALLVAMAQRRAEEVKANPTANAFGTTPDQLMSLFMRESRASRDTVLGALTKMQGVFRLVSLATNVDRISDRRLENTAALAALGVSGNLCVIDARTAASIEAATAEEAALQAHFAKFADKAAPLDAMRGRDNFGYRAPDRFKLEWITIPRATVEAGLQAAPELATLALKKRFAQDPAKYGAPTDGSGQFASFEAIVRSNTLKELVDQRMDAIAKFASDQLVLPQRSLKRDGIHFLLPAEWSSQMVALDALTQSIAAEFAIPAPSYTSSGADWVVAGDLDTKFAIGALMTDRFGQPTSLSTMILGAKELSKPNDLAPCQVNIASPPFKSSTGDVTFVRLLAAEPSRAAAALADVRDAVTADLAAISRFEWLEKNEAALAKQAVDEGLAAVAAKFGSTVVPANDVREANAQFLQYGFRIPGDMPGLGQDPKALAILAEKAAKLPFTQDLSTVPLAERTFTIPAPDRLSLVVFQVTALSPLTKEAYTTLAANPQSIGLTVDPDYGINSADLFSFDALSKRYDFKMSNLEADQNADAAKQDAAQASANG